MSSNLSPAGGQTTEALPVAPSLGPALVEARVPPERSLVDARVVFICGLSILVALVAGVVAQLLTRLIGLCTNLSFYGRLSTAFVSPADNKLGPLVVLVPVGGAIVVGLMARYGSAAIRGHGIPEAMEQVLLNKSRIPARITLLKPLSAAIAIGTGGPFGAEGPIIATGGALGSLLGQFLHTTAAERKTLLAAGAAAGMTATFGSPVAAVLLAVELLLFELRPRSLIPVALAAAAATAVRIAFVGTATAFAMPNIVQPSESALAAYIALGALVGIVAVGVTKAVYAIEDLFEHLPIHWMWWPAIGAVAVGVCGYFVPRTLGVGYDNIDAILSARVAGEALLSLAAVKLISWSISLGSGTSGGTLAPLFTIGGGLGALLGQVVASAFPHLGIDVRIAALVGMAAMFAGASRALLASVVFAFETTRQPMGLLPLLGGCSAAFLFSCLLMRNTIMTEKIARRGVRVPGEYAADFLDQITAGLAASKPVVTLKADDAVEQVRAWIATHGAGTTHQGFPVVDARGELVGVVTRRDLLGGEAGCVRDLIRRPVAVAFEDSSLREAADHMVHEGVGRLPVVSRAAPRSLVGIITRSDLLAAHRRRLEETHVAEQSIDWRRLVGGS
ncbi:MAG: chloride channel protein [Deltaproteobacteria bacterium]|nr:MAG: chloride channel protein [Deltaproteobacteria bacterium]